MCLTLRHPHSSLHQRINPVSCLVSRGNAGSTLTPQPEQAAFIVDGQLICHLDRVKVLTDQRVADAHRAQYRVILALVIGLTWAEQPKAVEAVLWFGG
jgi:hypothetical protein